MLGAGKKATFVWSVACEVYCMVIAIVRRRW